MSKHYDKLLTTLQVAEMLNIKVSTLYAWAFHKRQPLSYIKVGSRTMYRESDVQEFIQKGYKVISPSNNQTNFFN